MSARIYYDTELITMLDENDNSYMSINPVYDTGVLSLYYAPTSNSISEDTFEFKAVASEVTEETVAKFTIKKVDITTSEIENETMDDISFYVTIVPATNSSTSATTSDTSSTSSGTSMNNSSATDNTVTSDDSLAKTGENEIILIIIGGLIIMSITIIKKSGRLKKILNANKLLIMIPLLIGVFCLSGQKAKASTVTGIFEGISYNEESEPLFKALIYKNSVSISNTIDDGICEESGDKYLITLNVTGNFDPANDSITVNDLTDINLISSVGIYDKTYTEENAEEAVEKTDDDVLVSGDIVKKLIFSDNSDVASYVSGYTLLVYGDGNGDGKIAGTDDIQIIIDDYLHNTDYSGTLEKYAVDVYQDGKLNVFDIKRLIDLYNGYLDENDYVCNENVDYIDETTNEILYGDADCNGQVDIIDVILINQYTLGSATLTEQGMINADVNLDDAVNAEDSLIVLKFLVNLYESLPVTE